MLVKTFISIILFFWITKSSQCNEKIFIAYNLSPFYQENKEEDSCCSVMQKIDIYNQYQQIRKNFIFQREQIYIEKIQEIEKQVNLILSSQFKGQIKLVDFQLKEQIKNYVQSKQQFLQLQLENFCQQNQHKYFKYNQKRIVVSQNMCLQFISFSIEIIKKIDLEIFELVRKYFPQQKSDLLKEFLRYKQITSECIQGKEQSEFQDCYSFCSQQGMFDYLSQIDFQLEKLNQLIQVLELYQQKGSYFKQRILQEKGLIISNEKHEEKISKFLNKSYRKILDNYMNAEQQKSNYMQQQNIILNGLQYSQTSFHLQLYYQRILIDLEGLNTTQIQLEFLNKNQKEFLNIVYQEMGFYGEVPQESFSLNFYTDQFYKEFH